MISAVGIEVVGGAVVVLVLIAIAVVGVLVRVSKKAGGATTRAEILEANLEQRDEEAEIAAQPIPTGIDLLRRTRERVRKLTRRR